MGILSKLFSKGGKDIIDAGGRIIDEISSSDEEKLNAKQKLTDTVLSALNDLQSAQKEIIVAEAHGNWLQRSWRPIVMLAFAFIVVYSYFLQPAFFPKATVMKEMLPDEFWQLLNLGIGGYVIGRSAEKIATNVTKNSDITFLKKKDRKDVYG